MIRWGFFFVPGDMERFVKLDRRLAAITSHIDRQPGIIKSHLEVIRMAKKKKHKNNANPEMAKAMRDKRTSNAAGTHADKRTRRVRTRSSLLRKLLRDDT